MLFRTVKRRVGGNTPNIFVNELNLGPEKGPLPCVASGLSVLPLAGPNMRDPLGLEGIMSGPLSWYVYQAPDL